ncbi:hypothetical protein TVAG_231270 [Trichomonas vaginalis G3]|uniref:Uncharacterized protein n=1 Tax=Trichomonas vaginalis (strain ATCC PRA-98 / G3) TaxID=412133 RepID=A2F2S7_TRIV3|nr:hypothetical protein TVAGG3_0523890 [Trichomonas vaginalis G3]EAY00787.1 hypothetical protein TVAG_231270 [Trichomonas vaginalis G3]KAI5518635.1 hypothetical protein TVAGG3_0523890 [Trichomonas vaginalis G3]|eukprot:XP_001313716.1 hypothetical protein [Trichomonas vaginalis G3]
MSEKTSRTAAGAQPPPLGIFSSVPDPIDVQFNLRECPFITFKKRVDRTTASIYDLMYIVSKHHGGTVCPEDVHILIKVTDDEFRPVTDFTQRLSEFDKPTNEHPEEEQNAPDLIFYYDFTPVSGSLLTIPKLDNQK